MNKLIKRISYYAPVIRLIRFLGLKNFARKVYYWFNHPRNGVFVSGVNKVNAKYHVDNSDELRLVESVNGEWGEKEVISYLMKKISPKDCILDIGANIGIYTIFFAKSAPSGAVIAFEPEIKSFSRLKENINLNNIKNIITFNKALGSNNTTGKLSVGNISGNFSLINSKDARNFQEVEIVNGDDFFKKNDLSIPNIVKIDVEGYEYSVLKGLQNILSDYRCNMVCCEMHPDFLPKGVTESIIIEFLRFLGFVKMTYFKKPFFKPYHIIAEK